MGHCSVSQFLVQEAVLCCLSVAPSVLLWTERSGSCTHTSKGVFCIPRVAASTSALLFQPRGPASYFAFSL